MTCAQNYFSKNMATISDLINKAAEILNASEILEPRRDANLLIGLALGKDRAFIIANNNYELTRDEEETFLRFVERRAKREPYQHISGVQEFWKLEFMVSPDVLIPRPETEMIVEGALQIFGETCALEFCEVGIGSGCISISILDEIKGAKAFGVDISEAALNVASRNADKHSVSDRLKLGISDVFSAVPSREYDLIVSNPPYVPAKDLANLQIEVRKFDPRFALTDGASGLTIIEKIVNKSPDHLRPGGYLLMEIGFDQSNAVQNMFDLEIWEKIDIVPDLQGIPRMVKARVKA